MTYCSTYQRCLHLCLLKRLSILAFEHKIMVCSNPAGTVVDHYQTIETERDLLPSTHENRLNVLTLWIKSAVLSTLFLCYNRNRI